jgi:transposase, IS5 family
MRQRATQRSFAELEFEWQGVQLDPALRRISDFLDAHPELSQWIQADLQRALKRPHTGRRGLTGEQVLRAILLWRIKNWSYRELCSRIADGYTLRQFTRVGAQPVPAADAFQRSFARLQPDTVRRINDALLRAAVGLKLADGARLRVDTTVVESDIHYPSDSARLWDGIRTITRLVVEHLGPRLAGVTAGFPDRRRRARRRMQELSRMHDRRGKQERSFRRKYSDLLTVASEVTVRAKAVIEQTRRMTVSRVAEGLLISALRQEILHYTELTERVIEQTRRRIFAGETVPAEQKLYSLFEPHTDLIKRGKARKPVEFGHKVFLAESRPGLITDYRVLRGNPPDSEQVAGSLENHQRLFARAPKLYAADRGFDHPAARSLCEQSGVMELCIPQRGGKLSAARVATQHGRRFKAGQRYRAGIEGTISVLLRGRGMRRCLLEGPIRFELLVSASVLAANLLRLATLLERRARKRKPHRQSIERAA